MTISIAVESPLQDDVRALIAELNATLLELTPPEFVFHMTAEQMAEPETPCSSPATTARRWPAAR
jgi:putative acetyltransferase